MVDVKLLIIFNIFLIAAGGFVVVMLIYNDRMTPTWKKEARLIISHADLAKKLNKFDKLTRFWLTRAGLLKIYDAIGSLAIYTPNEAKVISLKLYQKVNRITYGGIILGLIAFRDLYNTLLIATVVVAIRDTIITNTINKMHFIMLEQLGQSCSSLRQAYTRLNSIPDAYAEAEVKPYCQSSFEDIFKILTENDSEDRLEEFIESNPFRITQTLATVSYLIDRFGDTNDSGQSVFTRAIDMIESEIRLELSKLRMIKIKFGSLKLLPLAVVPVIRIVEMFLMTHIPGTSIVYNGTLGYMFKTLIILLSLSSFLIISNMNSNFRLSKDDRLSLSGDLLSLPFWHDMVYTLTPKREDKLLKKIRLLEGAMSQMEPIHIYSKKLLYAISTFIVVLGVFYFSVFLGKTYTYENVGDLSLVAGKPLDKEDVHRRQVVDKYYLSLPRNMSKNDALKFVENKFPGLTHIEKDNMAERLRVKYDAYHNTKFKWHYILVAYLLALASTKIPELQLTMRKQLIRVEALEDVLQLQTLLVILSYTSVDTLESIYWLQKSSRTHSRLLMECFQDYPSDPSFALERLKVKAALPEMERLVTKLELTINQLSLLEAFNDLLAERDDMLRTREMVQTATIDKKRTIASPISRAPLIVMTIIYIIVPIGIVGIREFSTAMQSF